MSLKQKPPYTVYLGLGANLGNRAENIRAAIAALRAAEGIEVTKISPLYETEPWGVKEQPRFLNAAAAIVSLLSPRSLLTLCQRIEKALGRVREVRWGARTIDIDLLHIPGVVCRTPELTLPHPYLTQRAFVLIPLAAIAPDLAVEGRKIADWAAEVEGKDGVQRWEDPSGR